MDTEDQNDIVEDVNDDATGAEETTLDESSDDMRSTLSDAFKQHETDETTTDEAPDTLDTEGQQETAAASEPTDDKSAEPSSTDATADDSKRQEPKNEPKTDKPPVGWKAGAREAWDAVPEAAKKQIAEREREVALTMERTAQERRVAKSFSESMMPFKQALEGMGYSDPYRAINDIMGSAVRMRSGSPQDRALAAAQVIKSFGIDISELDTALVSTGVGSTGDTSQIETLLDQRLAPVNQFMTSLQQQQQQGSVNAAQSEIQQFSKDKEFIADVRLDMADLLDMAASRGQEMSLEDAYSKACALNPEVSKVMEQRRQQELSERAAQQTQDKRHAASSVSGTRAGTGALQTNETLEGDLNAAWDQLARRG